MTEGHRRAESRYRGDEGREYHNGKRGVPAEAVPWIARARARLFRPWVQATDGVFEFGAGAGWNLAALSCGRRVATDLAVESQEAIRGLGIEWIDGTDRLPARAWDVAICHHVLEHVADPMSALGELRRVLRVGGRLLLAVPFETGGKYRRYDPDEPNHHLFSWNVQSLGNLVTTAGFRLRSIGLRVYGYDRAAACAAVRWRLGERGFLLLRGLARTLMPIREIVAVGECLDTAAPSGTC